MVPQSGQKRKQKRAPASPARTYWLARPLTAQGGEHRARAALAGQAMTEADAEGRAVDGEAELAAGAGGGARVGHGGRCCRVGH